MSLDKYLEKMVLVPLERWEQLLKNEKDIREEREDSMSNDDDDDDDDEVEEEKNEKHSFPISEKSSVKEVKENIKETDITRLAPPGVPTSGINEIEEKPDTNENKKEVEYKPSHKKRKKKIKKEKTKKTFQWKNLP
jgi:hypothetical protein